MKYIDLFCGAGGVACGLSEAGWECIAAADADPAACMLYRTNFPSHPLYHRDLAKQPVTEDIHDGVLIGGPPCQDFSAATRQVASDRPRAAMTEVFAEHAARLAPRFVVYENVPRAASSAEFRALLATLRARGYTLEYETLHLEGLGMAQRRRRLILLASFDPEAVRVAWAALRVQFTRNATSIRDCFTDAGLASDAEHVYFNARDPLNRRSVYSVDDVAPTVRCSLRPFRERYVFTPRDSTQSRDGVIAPTPAHAAALQGFPSSYSWSGTKTTQARCIGNALPPPLAEAIAQAIDIAIS